MPTPQAASRPRRLKEAIAVLDLLADFPHLERIIDRWSIYDRSLSIIGNFCMPIASAIRKDLFEKEVWKSEESLIQAAEMLFTNTDHRVRVTKSSRFDDYYLYFTGENIRWEALCVLFTSCGKCSCKYELERLGTSGVGACLWALPIDLLPWCPPCLRDAPRRVLLIRLAEGY